MTDEDKDAMFGKVLRVYDTKMTNLKIHFEPEVIDDIYNCLGIKKPNETYQQMLEQSLIKEGYKMGYNEGTHKNQMTKQRKVEWECPECGNYHKWFWSQYDIFPGEITMTCDNPKCETKSKMIMQVDKKGNGTAVVYEDKELEDKLRRAIEKVMNSQTEIHPSRILKDNDFIWYMGEKYQKVEEPQKPKTLYQILYDDKWSDGGCNQFCDTVDEWMSQYNCDDVVCDASYFEGYNACLETLKSSLR